MFEVIAAGAIAGLIGFALGYRAGRRRSTELLYSPGYLQRRGAL